MRLVSLAVAVAAASSPITKVVNLLKEIKAGINADHDAEQQVYDKFACWCENTTSRKAKNIEQAKEDIQELGSNVLTLKGKVATLASEIAHLGQEIADNEAAQKQATAIREKENAAYQTEHSELEQTIGALEKAINVLTGAGTKKASLLAIKKAVSKSIARGNLSDKQVSLVSEFLRDFHDQKAQANQAYSPQSATIIGILKDMYTTFVMDLESETHEETNAQGAFEQLIATKQEELDTLQRTLTKKESQKGETEKQLADTEQNLADTRTAMEEDETFFDATAAQCKDKADEWSERSRLRTEELDGINKALEVLTSDDARALFNKAIKTGQEKESFVEVEATPRSKAFAALKTAAKKSHSLRLAALAAQVRGAGHFDAVISEIDAMVQVLKDEEAEDNKQRDWCKDTTHAKTEHKKKQIHKIKVANAKIDSLNAHVAKLDGLIQETADQIALTNQNIADMTAEREAEHAAYNVAKSDDEAAIDLLTQAVAHLSAFYKNSDIDQGKLEDTRHTLLQEPEFEVSEDQAPDAVFSDKAKHSGESKGALSLLTMVKEDLEAEVRNGVKAEKAAQTAYEKAKKAAEDLVASLEERKANLEAEKADTNENINSTTEDRDAQQVTLDDLNAELAEIKPNCDWILGAFEKRRDYRRAEMQGLTQAKEILSGATLGLISKKTAGAAFLAETFVHVAPAKGFLAK
jgi:chromosome segregation ATPase